MAGYTNGYQHTQTWGNALERMTDTMPTCKICHKPVKVQGNVHVACKVRRECLEDLKNDDRRRGIGVEDTTGEYNFYEREN